MKTKLLSTFIICLFIVFDCDFLNAQNWVCKPTGTSLDLHSVFFINADTGFAAGNMGTILETTDGGTNWIIKDEFDIDFLGSIFFVNANIGYAVGSRAMGDTAILKTTDGGNSWIVPYSSSVLHSFSSVYFTDSITGYVVGYGTGVRIMKTIDGGFNWVVLNANTTNILSSVFFANKNIGYSVGQSGTIVKTIDGGNNWTSQSSNTVVSLNSIFSPDTSIGYAVGSQGVIIKTTDGGINWTSQTSGTANDLYSVFFNSVDTGYVVGRYGTILKTTNGGSNWIIQNSGTSNYLGSVFFINDNIGYIAGCIGIILKTTNGGQWINEINKEEIVKIFPNPVNDKLTIDALQKSTMVILDIQGQTILQLQIQQGKTDINISELASGVYILRLCSNDKTEVARIVKE